MSCCIENTTPAIWHQHQAQALHISSLQKSTRQRRAKIHLSDRLNDGCAVQEASQRLPLTSHKASSACNMQSIQHLSGKLYESIVDVLVVQASVKLLTGGMQESQRPVARSLWEHSVELSLGFVTYLLIKSSGPVCFKMWLRQYGNAWLKC